MRMDTSTTVYKSLTALEVGAHTDRETVLKALEELYEDHLIGRCSVCKNDKWDDVWFNVGVGKGIFVLKPAIRYLIIN